MTSITDRGGSPNPSFSAKQGSAAAWSAANRPFGYSMVVRPAGDHEAGAGHSKIHRCDRGLSSD